MDFSVYFFFLLDCFLFLSFLTHKENQQQLTIVSTGYFQFSTQTHMGEFK